MRSLKRNVTKCRGGVHPGHVTVEGPAVAITRPQVLHVVLTGTMELSVVDSELLVAVMASTHILKARRAR